MIQCGNCRHLQFQEVKRIPFTQQLRISVIYDDILALVMFILRFYTITCICLLCQLKFIKLNISTDKHDERHEGIINSTITPKQCKRKGVIYGELLECKLNQAPFQAQLVTLSEFRARNTPHFYDTGTREPIKTAASSLEGSEKKSGKPEIVIHTRVDTNL